MTAQDVLEKFGELPLAEKKKVVTLLLRESLDIETPALSDNELILNAEEVFLELDKAEERDARS